MKIKKWASVSSQMDNQFDRARSLDPAVHYSLFFRFTIAYVFYRVISRPAFAYGALDPSFATYPRPATKVYPPLVHEVVSFAWVHKFFWPTPEFLNGLQLIILLACVLAFLGYAARACSLVVFTGLLYQTSLMQMTNSELDGGTLVLALCLWFAVQKKGLISRVFSRAAKTPTKHAGEAILGSQMIVGAFYFYSGLNKLVDVGPGFPWQLSLPNLAEVRRYEILWSGARLGEDRLLQLMENEILSVIGGAVVLGSELLLLPALLFFRRLRLPAVLGLVSLHFLVLFAAGINFMGNSILLFAALDISRFQKLSPRLRRSQAKTEPTLGL